MKLTCEQDYAIRIVYELCKTDSKLTVNEISAKTGVTPLFTQKIMRKLCASDIVSSIKGNQGGYTVCENREKLSVYDVFKAINGDLCINGCLSSEDGCCSRPEVIENHGECVIRKAIAILNADMVKSLKQIKFINLINGGK